MSADAPVVEQLPVIIVGAGICGLLLARLLRQASIPYLLFERDDTFRTRGAGWGLTLHWSLQALRQLLPDDLLAQLPGTYVDRAAVERGELSRYPFFDLSTGQLQGSSPPASEHQRIRVTRERLRRLLAGEIEIQWGKTFCGFREDAGVVTAIFDDETEYRGHLIIGCDGSHSRVRKALLHTESINHPIPVKMVGFTISVPADQAKFIRDLDPFFLQGTSSASNMFMFISLLEAPEQSCYDNGSFVYQICISWNTSRALVGTLPTDGNRVDLIRQWSRTWAEPFRSFVAHITDETVIKELDLDDFAPQTGIHPKGNVVLLGDALHAMSMYRGEGANHVIVDALDFKNIALPQLVARSKEGFQAQSNKLLEAVIERTRPAVLASRQACLDAHDWQGLSPSSPLLTKRQMHVEFNE